MSRFLNALRPLIRIMPEVKAPERTVSFREKFAWTAIILLLYLIMSNVQIYGVDQQQVFDYFFWMRIILASNRGTLMELGIGPIVTAGLIMQLLVGSQLIRVDMSDPYERALYTGAQKVLAVFMTAFQAIAYIAAGAYGPLDLGRAVLIFIQLMFAGVIVILMDEMVQKGWGLGSGVSLFIMANVCSQIIWNMFSFSPSNPPEPTAWLYGAFPFLFQNIGAALSGGQAVDPITLWIRPGNARASLLGVIVTFIVFLVVIYMESLRVNIPLQYARYRGFRGQYPIKLLYVSNIPVIFTQALYANILFFTQILWQNPSLGIANQNNPLWFWFWILAHYEVAESGNYLIPQPVCLVWFLTPPQGLHDIFFQEYIPGIPGLGVVRAAGYALILIALCAGFAKIWIDVSGIASRDISRQLVQAGMQVPGFRRSPAVIEKILDRYIPTVAVLGGILIGALAAFADFLGALSTGVGILLAVGIMRQYFEILAKEQLSEMHPMLRGLLGVE